VELVTRHQQLHLKVITAAMVLALLYSVLAVEVALEQ
jgi:hypothetical protein